MQENGTMAELFVASLTPFRPTDGAVDHAWIAGHLRWLAAHGADGVVPCGTTGEGPSLGLAERKAVIETVLAHRGGLRVIAGTGCVALGETIEATRHALALGADAALVIPPYYFKAITTDGLLAYYRAVCDALPAGGQIMLYHIPPVSQIAITTELIDGLLDSHPGAVMGLKDSGGDAAHTAMLTARYPQLRIYTGGAPLLARALRDGAAGGIFALANAFAPELRAIIAAHDAGADSDVPQRAVVAINEALKPLGAVPALKALVPVIAGLPATTPRPPLLPLPDGAASVQARLAAVAGQ
jgi:4-hydroxy-tetrahydrodipicolinate synthase